MIQPKPRDDSMSVDKAAEEANKAHYQAIEDDCAPTGTSYYIGFKSGAKWQKNKILELFKSCENESGYVGMGYMHEVSEWAIDEIERKFK